MTGLVPTKGLTPTKWPGGAHFSPGNFESEPYRTWLWRECPWLVGDANKKRVAFICLNPSTARSDWDDATIRKLIGFAERWGYAALDVFNLWDLRTRDPKVLRKAGNHITDLSPLGPSNDTTLSMYLPRASRIVCAWGSDAMVKAHPERVAHVRKIAECSCQDVVALRLSQDGHPWHPLYVRYDVTPLPYRADLR